MPTTVVQPATAKKVKHVLKIKEKRPYKKASPLRISTISAVSFLNAGMDFGKLFKRLPLVCKDGGQTGVFSMKHYDKSVDEDGKKIVNRRIRCKDAQAGETLVSTVVQKYFQNQITILWTFISSAGDKRKTNGFMFTNGKIKAVGLKCDEDIHRSFRALRDYLQLHLSILADAVTLPTTSPECSCNKPRELHLHGTRATMYNTDFCTHFQIMRDELFRIIIEEYLLDDSEFEPDIYPAVKIKFAWNTDYIPNSKHTDKDKKSVLHDHTPGVCYCQNRCNGKGTGSGDGQCKVVTVCVFGNDAPNRHGGKIIITGANSYRQVEDVYQFMNAVLKKHYDRIVYREPFMAADDTNS